MRGGKREGAGRKVIENKVRIEVSKETRDLLKKLKGSNMDIKIRSLLEKKCFTEANEV